MRVALLAVFLCGCLSASPGTEGPADVQEGAVEPLVIPADAADCQASTAIVLIERPQIAPYLPLGFHARDARGIFQDWLGLPLPGTGKVPVFVATIECAEAEAWTSGVGQGFAAILIEPPNVAGINSTAGFDFYELVRFHDDPVLGQTLSAVQWPTHEATATVNTLRTLAGQTTSTATVSDETGTLYQITVVSPAENPNDGPTGFGEWELRMWHVHEGGLAFFEYRFSHDVAIGQPVCQFAAGSALAKALGHESCPPLSLTAGTDSSVGATFVDLEYNGRFVAYDNQYAS